MNNDRRRQFIAVACVLTAAAVLRVVYLLQYHANVPYYDVPVMDALYYDQWAQRVAAGQGYGPSPYYLAPLYPYVLAVAYAVFGRHFTLIYAAQAAIGIGSLFLVYTIGRRIFGHGAGLAAVLLLMLYGPVLFLESKLLSETLSLFLNLVAVYALLRALDGHRPPAHVAAGLGLGLSIVCRPANLLFASLLLACRGVGGIRARAPARLLSLLWLSLGIVVPILPVTARNWYVGRDFALIQTNGGMTFAQGNNENAVGLLAMPPGTTAGILGQQAEEVAIASRAMGRPLRPSEASSYWFRQGLAYIRNAPADYAVLVLRKLLYAFTNREAHDNYEYDYETGRVPVLRWLCLPYSVLFGFAVVGFVQARGGAGRRGANLLGLYLAGVLLTLLIFYMTARYRMPALPVLAILAGAGLIRAVEHVRVRSLPGICFVLASVVGATLLGEVRYPAVSSRGSNVLGNVAKHHVNSGEMQKAIDALHEALRINPEDGYAQMTLGCVLSGLGRTDEAVEWLRKAVEKEDAGPMALVALADLYLQQKNLDEAERCMTTALARAPRFAPAHDGAARIRLLRGDVAGAVAGFEQAVRLEPASAEFHFHLGCARMAQGEFAKGIEHLSEAHRLDPESKPIADRLEEARALLPGRR